MRATLKATTIGLALLSAACGGGGTGSNGADALLVVSGNGQVALPGTAVAESLVVRLVDGSGNGIGSVTVTWTVTGGGGAIAPASTVTDGTGRAAARWTLGAAAGPNGATATAAGQVASFTATASGTAPSRLALTTQPAGQTGVPLAASPVVQIQDANGVGVAQQGVTVTAAIASGSQFASLSGTTSAVTGPNGAASFGGLVVTGPVGSYTLRFSSGNLTQATSTAFVLGSPSGRIPLTDMGTAFTYLGQFQGGLYPGGSNTMPAAHAAAGAAAAGNIQPRAANGAPSASGKIVLVSVGMSNTTQEFCNAVWDLPCDSWTFSGQAAADPTVDHADLVIVNGARGGQDAPNWDDPGAANWDRVRDSALTPAGLSEAQVQVLWIKQATSGPTVGLPSAQADAVDLLRDFAQIVRAAKVRYPNLQIAFLSTRIYAGYANGPLNPEPYAYEGGFAVKWVIEAQIDQMANGGTVVDARAGDLDYTTGAAPWIAWGPYLWADGTNPRSDGLTWVVGEFEPDGTHPAQAAETKVGTRLLNFFKTDPRASCWFLAGQVCP